MTPSPDLLHEAREIVATVFEGGSKASKRCASDVREGRWDDTDELEMVLAALRRGMVLATRDARAALQPFADCLEYIGDNEDDEEWAKFRLLISDYRRAAKVLAALPIENQS